MLAGAYPSDEFAELKPRVTWDRLTDVVEGRRDARVVAVTSGGTIPDRGLYPVFLEGEAGTPGRRVGELDEEMVYELRAGMHGDVVVLGASSWRVADITRQPGHGDAGPGRARQAAVLARRRRRPAGGAGPGDRRVRARASRPTSRRARRGGRGPPSACGATTTSTTSPPRTCSPTSRTSARPPAPCPTDRRIVIERFRDELGDWRLVVLTPFGGRVHAPWTLAIEARLQERLGLEVQTIYSDDGIAIRLPEGDCEPRRRGGAAVPGSRRGRGPGRRAGRRRRACSPAGSGRTPRGPCSCRAGGPGRGPRSGSSASARRTCSPWQPATAASRSSWRPTASAWPTCSTCRPCARSWAACSGGRSPSTRWRRRGRRRSRAVAAVRLRRRLHVRGRRAAGRAPGPGADAGPRPPAGAAGPGGAARAAGPRRRSRTSS